EEAAHGAAVARTYLKGTARRGWHAPAARRGDATVTREVCRIKHGRARNRGFPAGARSVRRGRRGRAPAVPARRGTAGWAAVRRRLPPFDRARSPPARPERRPRADRALPRRA